MILKKIFFVFILFMAVFSTNAQEILVDLNSYYIPKNENYNASAKSKNVLELPFFDDFSRPTTFPTRELWEKSYVITNQSYAINPPTNGVATFDAVNQKGELYSNLSTNPQGADTLVSHSINLGYSASDSVYLSFQFQPQGRGYEPSSKDSLVLEFWDNNQQKWIRAWSATVNFSTKKLTQKNIITSKSKTIQSDTLNRSFYNAVINISEPGFLTSNFKFRFINYASLSANTLVPGLKSNSDHWHIDMIYLDYNRTSTDTIFNDITFSEPVPNPMINYTSVPWSHFTEAKQVEFPNPKQFTISYHNLGYTTWNISRRFKIIDLSGSQSEYFFSGGAENIFALQRFNYSRYFDYTFSSAWEDSAKFNLQSYLITDIFEETKHFRYNDTISKTIEFHNYYSFDDGSAESGYGLFGEGTEDGMVAYKFHNYKSDNLLGIMIYFNRTFKDANQVTFKLTVWDNDNGKPGNIVYQRQSVRPIFTDSLNTFTVYRIDPTQIPEGEFFIGWVQTNQDMLNVGFDLNNDEKDRIFYNISGNWVNTKFEGTLMIRPIFGKMHQIPTNVTPNSTNQNISVYPNPAKDNISIKVDNDTEIESIQIINSIGNIVLSQNYTYQEPINIQSIPTGFYIVKVCPKKGKCITSKLMIVR